MSGKLDWLVGWYTKECRSDDKKSIKIRIVTLDNPGWILTLELEGTMLGNNPFNEVDINRSKDDWIQCDIKDNKFDGACGPLNLSEVLTIFREWAEPIDEPTIAKITADNRTNVPMKDDINWLMGWYYGQCNGDWEHCFGAIIKTSDTTGWRFTIEFENTELEGLPFTERKIKRSEDDWIHCYVDHYKFEGHCGPRNLLEVLRIFREWAESVEQ
jgi:hypothetical protein